MAVKWHMKGEGIGSCSCDWGCPCNFDAPPSNGWCEGGYGFHITDGNINDVKLDGLTIGAYAHSPQALHLGNVTMLLLIDEKATAEQRDALQSVADGNAGGPWAVFSAIRSKLIGPEFVPVEWKWDGPNSYVKFGDKAEARLQLIKNPVTGEESTFTLKMGAGLLTNEADLMASSTFRVAHPELSYDHSGQYGEVFRFDWSGEG